MPPPSPRILIADDNRDAADTLALVLQLVGYEVQVAYDGVAAVQAAEAWAPTVCILDIHMPGLDGYEVARRVRRQSPAPVVLIALSAAAFRDHASDAFDHHLVKPADVRALETILQRASPP